jgi:hypothetical protein
MSRNNAKVLSAAEWMFAKRAKQVAEAQGAMNDYLDAQKRIEERTRKLRELRLARDAAAE